MKGRMQDLPKQKCRESKLLMILDKGKEVKVEVKLLPMKDRRWFGTYRTCKNRSMQRRLKHHSCCLASIL